MRLVYPAALLVSAAAIGFEILLMRLLSIVQWHHFAYMIISLALFGYAASGTVIALARRFLEPRFPAAFSMSALLFSVTMVGSFHASQRVPFNGLAVVWDPSQLLGLAAICAIIMIPFFFAASCIGLAFAFRSAVIDRIYFFDLTGAGIGGLLIILVLFRLLPQHALILLSLLALSAAALVLIHVRTRSRWTLAALLLATLLLLAGGTLRPSPGLRMSEFKSLSQTLQVVDTRVLEERSSPLGLLTVVESPTIPFRHAPGMSFLSGSAPPEQLAVFHDGDDMSVITRFDGDFSTLDYVAELTSSLPYHLVDKPRVLVLGAGAGSDVLQALYHGAGSVDAVELNSQMVGIVRDSFGDFAGRIYDDERVNIHVNEARGFVTRDTSRYDLIQVALLDSFATAGAGTRGLSESYLYTVEAIGLYLDRLSPDGILSITRWLRPPARDSLKLAATAIEALRQTGVADPDEHLAVIRSWNTVTLLLARSPLSAERIDVVRQFARSRSFDTAWYPGMAPEEANRFNRLDEPQLFAGISALLGTDATGFAERYKFNIAPATDDRPYFFHFFKWGVLPEMIEIARQGGAGLIEWGYLILLATFVQAALAGVLIILLPLRAIRRNWDDGLGTSMGTYFFLLGLAFLFVEIAFIQKFTLFLSHPLYSVAVVLSGFLVFAGLGSVMSGDVTRLAARIRIGPVTLAVSGVALITLSYIWLMSALFERLAGLSDLARIMVSMLLIAPLAFCMGMPFPIGLKSVAEEAPGFIPWAWGINGFASVVSATLATLLAIQLGFTAVLVIAIVLYAGAAAVLARYDSVLRRR